MIKMMAAVCRRPGMTHAEYLSYVQNVHGALAVENPVGLRRYVQNHVFDSAFGTASELVHTQVVSRDSVTELYWDSPQDMAANFAHEHVRTRVGPDAVNFADLSVSLSLVATEVEQPVVSPGAGQDVKVLHYLRAAEGLSLPGFFTRWAQAHERALRESPEAAAAIRRCVHSRQEAKFNSMLAYFSPKDLPIYEGVASLWFDDSTAVTAFRAYERALIAFNSEPDGAFFRPAVSYFVYANEVKIYERSA